MALLSSSLLPCAGPRHPCPRQASMTHCIHGPSRSCLGSFVFVFGVLHVRVHGPSCLHLWPHVCGFTFVASHLWLCICGFVFVFVFVASHSCSHLPSLVFAFVALRSCSHLPSLVFVFAASHLCSHSWSLAFVFVFVFVFAVPRVCVCVCSPSRLCLCLQSLAFVFVFTVPCVRIHDQPLAFVVFTTAPSLALTCVGYI
jgi:hypothetical protein